MGYGGTLVLMFRSVQKVIKPQNQDGLRNYEFWFMATLAGLKHERTGQET